MQALKKILNNENGRKHSQYFYVGNSIQNV